MSGKQVLEKNKQILIGSLIYNQHQGLGIGLVVTVSFFNSPSWGLLIYECIASAVAFWLYNWLLSNKRRLLRPVSFFFFFPLHGPWYVEKLEMFFCFFAHHSLNLSWTQGIKPSNSNCEQRKRYWWHIIPLFPQSLVRRQFRNAKQMEDQKCQQIKGSALPKATDICIDCSGLSGFLVSAAAHADFWSSEPDGIGYQPVASDRFESCTRSIISARVGSSGIVGSTRLVDYLEAALQTTIIPSSITSTWAATPI